MSLHWDQITVVIVNNFSKDLSLLSQSTPGHGEFSTQPAETLPHSSTTTAFVGQSSGGSELGFEVSSVQYQLPDGTELTLSCHMPFAAGQETTLSATLGGLRKSSYGLTGIFPGSNWHGQGRRDTATITLSGTSGAASVNLTNKN